MGALPDWYPVIRAARYLGVAPWALLDQSSVWQQWALTAEAAENEAQQAQMERAQTAPAAS